ncbi:hypothetical protein F2Q68_00032808 [Brassica cretica]|uniref:Uncharacterized protein n=1 Tax=Brassica cretica TaxID=69181 RepID=A0A8S9GE95_BRACR|nr:hypothetical protein F2Q68_00032808 [Brassica cretica]KAF3602239.1 hypothetical protein F2Q69_00038535 [Brassica cretica]
MPVVGIVEKCHPNPAVRDELDQAASELPRVVPGGRETSCVCGGCEQGIEGSFNCAMAHSLALHTSL